MSAVMLPWFPAQVYFMQTDNLVSRLAIAKDKVGAPLASSNMLPFGCHVTYELRPMPACTALTGSA